MFAIFVGLSGPLDLGGQPVLGQRTGRVGGQQEHVRLRADLRGGFVRLYLVF